MARPDGGAESHTLRGPTDRGSLVDIRGVFTRDEPLATATLDDPVNPGRLVVSFEDGIGAADAGRFEVVWTTRDDYAVHYTDDERDLRWDRHPHGGDYHRATGPAHFHPPADASSDPDRVADSCIEQTTPTLVARAVLALWRAAYERGSAADINSGSNPP